MSPEVHALSTALDELRARLIDTPRTSAGFGEMRMLYLELTNALIVAGDKHDLELAKQVETASNAISDEWTSNKDKIQPWLDVLLPVIAAVGAVLQIGKLSNPLLAILP